MLISTKGRYALRFMIDLAKNQGEGCVSLKTIAERQNISLKYLESIAKTLTVDGLVISTRGKCGGYRLADEPCNLKVGKILHSSQGKLNTVECSHGDGCNCTKGCLTKTLWTELDKTVNQFFDNISLQDLLDFEEKDKQELVLIRKDKNNESLCR